MFIIFLTIFLLGFLVAEPTFDSTEVNVTIARQPALFSVVVSDSSSLEQLGQYIFSTNNTGTWINDSAVNFTSTPQTITSVKILNSNPGILIGFRWYSSDNSSITNSTPIYSFFTTADTTFPTASLNSSNNSYAGQLTRFSIYINDNFALNPNGQYIFSTNNTGTWINDSAVNFTSTPSWADVTKTLNSTVGTFVGYRWYFNDSAGNLNFTSIYTLNTTADLVSPNYSSKSVNNTDAGQITKFSITVNDNLALNPSGQYIFSTNNSGSWANNSAVSFTSTPATIIVTKILSSDVDKIIGYRWYFTDNFGNKNSTPIYTLKTSEAEEDSVSSSDEENVDEVMIFKPTTSQLQVGFEGYFRKSDIIRLNLSNITYIVQIKEINRNLMNVTFSFNNTNYSVWNNYTLKINANNDAFYDLQVSLVNITYTNSSRMVFKEINEEIPQAVRDAIKASSTVNSTTNSSKPNIKIKEKKKNTGLYILGGIILLGGIGFGIWKFRQHQRYMEYGY